MTATLNRLLLSQRIEQLAGQFIGVTYVKQDGSTRRLNGRLGVRRHLKGGVNTVARDDRPYLTVWDAKNKGYRTVNLATVTQLRARHEQLDVIG